MTLFGLIGFTTPWLLLGLLALPILWIILRAVPPAPIRRMFPGVVLLLGLKDEEQVTDRTPWWLLLLRMLAVAAVIIGLAGPVLNPDNDGEVAGDAPLLVVMDASWASAADWRGRMIALDGLLAEAGRDTRPVALMRLTDPTPVQFLSADVLRTRLSGIQPEPWQPDAESTERAIGFLPETRFDTYWMSDALDREGRTPLLAALEAKGRVTVFEAPRTLYALEPAQVSEGNLLITARRLREGGATELTLAGHGKDPAGNPAVLTRNTLSFEAGMLETTTEIALPAELRARIERFEIEGTRSAGAVTLPDDSLRRREVALIAGSTDREGLELLSPLHYLQKALVPTADLLDGALLDILPANPDVIILADVATLSAAEEDAVLEWLDKGGMLLRFAGPRLAASDISRDREDPLMPVRLRAGGRTVGGAMSWGEPKSLAPFPAESPFFGLAVPSDVTVNSQVMAQPDPTLAARVAAQLSDGTPLVTRKAVGQGQIVLFHVTANAEWSTLPLSGLFVQMLERLAVSSAAAQPEIEDMEGTVWQPIRVLDAFGRPREAGTLPGVDGPALIEAPLGPDLRPGVYQGEDRSLARNVVTADTELTPMVWPERIPVQGITRPQEKPLAGWLLAGAIALLLADVIASLMLSGRLRGAVSAGVVLAALILAPQDGQAQTAEERAAIAATSEVVLAYVITGDDTVDDLSLAGLRGLSETMYFRTSVEPNTPVGVNLETDELAFYPMIYWPITASQPTPSREAYAKLNTYLRTGGMIVFDTRDADIAGFGAATPEGRKLQQLAAPLDIPPLEPVPEDHVLTRTFYLLQDFPGRYVGREVWVEAAPPDAELIEGMPFRDLNDNVTPVVIGGNDWASAWAMDDRGNPLVPLGSGFTGERQREIAYRFGVNLVMHVLTGNYKSDQVHVPALLDRLGQ
ncbi:MAG: LytTR family transcriptional regulator [Mameliella sp.]|nr:LytTR family transcriptional regulator [Mameliella sp.]